MLIQYYTIEMIVDNIISQNEFYLEEDDDLIFETLNIDNFVEVGDKNKFLPEFYNYKFSNIKLDVSTVEQLFNQFYSVNSSQQLTRNYSIINNTFEILINCIKNNQKPNDVNLNKLLDQYKFFLSIGKQQNDLTIDHKISNRLFVYLLNWGSVAFVELHQFLAFHKTLNSFQNFEIKLKSTNSDKAILETSVLSKIKNNNFIFTQNEKQIIKIWLSHKKYLNFDKSNKSNGFFDFLSKQTNIEMDEQDYYKCLEDNCICQYINQTADDKFGKVEELLFPDKIIKIKNKDNLFNMENDNVKYECVFMEKTSKAYSRHSLKIINLVINDKIDIPKSKRSNYMESYRNNILKI